MEHHGLAEQGPRLDRRDRSVPPDRPEPPAGQDGYRRPAGQDGYPRPAGQDPQEGVVALDRQERPVRLDVRGRPIVPQRVPETRPTPLQEAFVYLSIVVLVCGVVAIGALELGLPPSAPIVKLPVVAGGLVLVALTVDAIVRIWRAAWAWMAIDRGRGAFRLLWDAVLAVSLVVVVGVMLAVASA